MQAPIVIIGSGLAGYMLAKEFRKLDSESPLTIITQGDGSFYSKPLLSTALAQQKDIQSLITSSAVEMAQQLNAKILTHSSVEEIHPLNKEMIVDGKTIHYHKAILACGSSPISPRWEGDANAEIFSVNDLAAYGLFREALKNKTKVVIIGAGLVGCEFANDLVSAGYEVDVFAMESYPLNDLLTPQVGSVLADALAKAGVRWHFNQQVQKVNKSSSGYQLTTRDGSVCETDVVLSAIGIRPNTILAQASNLQVDDGIVVDAYLQTSVEDIYALGDCAKINNSLYQYVAPLLQSARALAKTLAGEKTLVQFPAMPVAVKTTICPLVIAQPLNLSNIEWKVTGDANDLQALCYSGENQLSGFILSGNMTKERARLQRELPPLF